MLQGSVLGHVGIGGGPAGPSVPAVGRGTRLQVKPAVAIGTYDEAFLADLEIDERMAVSATAAVARYLCGFHFDCFGRFHMGLPVGSIVGLGPL